MDGRRPVGRSSAGRQPVIGRSSAGHRPGLAGIKTISAQTGAELGKKQPKKKKFSKILVLKWEQLQEAIIAPKLVLLLLFIEVLTS